MPRSDDAQVQLYLIEILHQTTTGYIVSFATLCCILSKFYIKPQRPPLSIIWLLRCILSKFYIKPQPLARVRELLEVVSYRNSTSNHNSGDGYPVSTVLYLIEILHQTTTACLKLHRRKSCILSKFYIKPQLVRNYYAYSQCCILSKFYIKPQPQEESC